MAIIGGEIGYRLLHVIAPNGPKGKRSARDPSERYPESKLEKRLGTDVWNRIGGKVVIDFGCGVGTDAIELAKRGARRVIGLDIRESVLDIARARAAEQGVDQRCIFTTRTEEPVDIVVSIDAFEHFADPRQILDMMYGMLCPDGRLLTAFGMTWYHPYGGHGLLPFPWVHLLFTGSALMRWREDFRSDGARRFSEREDGLNQMTIKRFIRLVEESRFLIERLECVPIRRLRLLHNRLTREFCTTMIRAELVKN